MKVLQGLFRSHRDRFEGLRLRLTRAGVTTTYDDYLARATRRILLPLLAAAVAAATLYTSDSSTAAAAVTVAGFAAASFVAVAYAVYPRLRAARRRREIDAALPHVLVLTNSLARAGMDVADVADVVADSGDVYGEISVEFARLRREIEWYGEDMLTALDVARDSTPSDDLRDLFDDLSGVLESQTSFVAFAESRYREQFEDAEAQQMVFLNRLKSFAQAYVVLLFVGPLFGLVLLVLLSFVGANTLPPIYAVAYVYPVVGVSVAVLALNGLEGKVGLSGLADPSPPSDDVDVPRPSGDDEVYRSYRRGRLRSRLSNWSPREAVYRRPLLSLAVSVPVAVAAAAGLLRFEGRGFRELYATEPVSATAVVAACAVVVFAPVAALYRRRLRRRRRYVSRIPDAMESMREAVEVGVSPVDACRLVEERIEGEVADDLGRIHRLIHLTGDPLEAFEEVGRRRGVPEFSLAMKTLKEATKATEDVEETLASVAEGTRARVELSEERRRSMELYAVVVALGLSVFVVTAAFLELFFLPRLAEVSEAGEQGFLAPAAVPPETYSTVLYQATLIQATVHGLFVGKLRDGNVWSGLTYSVVFVVLATVPFLLL